MSIHARWSSGNLVFQEKSGIGCLQVGEMASLLKGSGLALSTNRTAAFRAYADDGGVALTAGAYRAAMARMLLTIACAAGDISVYGYQSQLRVNADYHLATGILGGEWAYLEVVSGGQVLNAAALVAQLDVASGATIGSGGYAAGVLIKSNTLAGTHTGKAVAIYALNSQATVWDAFLALDASSDFLASSGAGGGTSKYLKVLVGGVAYSILVKSDA